MTKYNPSKIEKKWQKYWEAKKFYIAPDPVKANGRQKRPISNGASKFYFLVEFPYPSGNLHIGHWYRYSVPDITARYLRMKGKNVMYPIGFDAFGLPAENAAIKNNFQPADWTKKNIAYMTKQLKSIGASFDWSREVKTTDPEYYKWTQWIFLQFYKKGLAYRAKTLVNWCPKDKTVLANEQVADGKCDRCGAEVAQKELSQWMFKITEYADRLIDDLDRVDWPEAAKTAQRNWIGRSRGAEIHFLLPNSKETIKVFTTRADTLYGATYIVLAPEHPLVTKITKDERLDAVNRYLEEVRKKSELERISLEKEKTGVFTGAYAVNPVNNERIPIWIADYVLGQYGTGAVMAVPAHDERDFEFAKKYKLPVRRVITKKENMARSYLMGAEEISDQELKNIGVKIIEKTKDGDRKLEVSNEQLEKYEKLINDKLTPGFWNEYVGAETVFMFKHKDGEIERLVLNAENEGKINELAKEFAKQNFVSPGLMLAENNWYLSAVVHEEDGILVDSGGFTGYSSADAREEIVEKLATQKLAHRKINYKLHDWVLSRQRYWGAPIPIIHCKHCGYQPVPEKDLPVKLPKLENYKPSDDGRSPLAKATDWLKVQCPLCGKEGERETDTMDTFVDSSWYFLRYTDPKNKKTFADPKKMKLWLPVNLYVGGEEHNTMHLLYSRFFTKALYDLKLIDFEEPFTVRRNGGNILGPDGQKMSKSHGNVVDPDEQVKNYGADAVRMYLAFMGPYELGGPWKLGGISGVFRFLNRVWNIFQDKKSKSVKPSPETKEKLDGVFHKTIKKVGEDIENMRFNTVVSGMMKLLNEIEDYENSGYKLDAKNRRILLKLLAPIAPHLTEEIWMAVLKNKKSIHLEKWPEYDPKLIVETTVNLVAQINGKIRSILVLPANSDEGQVKTAVLNDGNIKKHLEGKEIKKIIFVKNRLINFVV